MKKSYSILVIILICISNNVFSQCFNGDVENNSFVGWSCYTSLNTTGFVNLAAGAQTPGIVSGRQNIMTGPGNDPYESSISLVNQGNHSIRLGSNTSNSQKAQTISFTVTVTNANANFSFSYALVMQDPGHGANANPFFEYWASKTSNITNSMNAVNLVPGSNHRIVADGTNPFFTKDVNFVTNKLVYKRWQTACLNLTPYIGRTITLFFHTAGCTQFGHWGYAYIDGLCTPNDNAIPSFVLPQGANYNCPTSIIADGSASSNVTDYFWLIRSLSSSNPNSIIANTSIMQNFYNQPVGTIDLYNWYINNGGIFKPGYYLVTLGVRTCSGQWKTISMVIYINTILINLPTQYTCCEEDAEVAVAPVILHASVGGGVTGQFYWYDINNNFIGNGITTGGNTNTINVGYFAASTKYLCKFISSTGCVSEAYEYVIVRPYFSYSLVTDFCFNSCVSGVSTISATNLQYYMCNYNGVPQDQYYNLETDPSQLTYTWNTGEHTSSISVHPGVTLYSLTVTNGCWTVSEQVDISTYHPLSGFLPATASSGPYLWYTSGFTPGSSTERFIFYQYGLPGGAYPAYDATAYQLYIYDRWGTLIYGKYVSAPCEGFHNGDINWNGLENTGPGSGTLCPGNVVFNWMLYLYNCNAESPTGNSKLYKGNVTSIE